MADDGGPDRAPADPDRAVRSALPLELSGVVRHFDGIAAVDGVDLSLEPGELLALVGPSGCGKSTLLRIIAGLVELDAGEVRLDGQIVSSAGRHLPPERRRVGLVFQEHALFPHLTVAENVAFGIRDVSRREITERVDEVLDLVELGDFGRRYPHELSGGERQRVALARALAPRPTLLLLDEPFASLDPNLRGHLRSAVTEALRATGTPAVFVTHDQTEALAVGDRIAVMRDGRVQQWGTPEEVFHHPTEEFVAAFMGEAAFLPLNRSDAGLSTPLGPVEIHEAEADPGAYLAMVRPDDVVFDREPVPECDPQSGPVAGPDSGRGGAAGEVVAAEYRGDRWCYTIRLSADTDTGCGGADACTVLAFGSHLRPLAVGCRGRAVLRPGHRQTIVHRGSVADLRTRSSPGSAPR